jgi:hypothetical protein
MTDAMDNLSSFERGEECNAPTERRGHWLVLLYLTPVPLTMLGSSAE